MGLHEETSNNIAIYGATWGRVEFVENCSMILSLNLHFFYFNPNFRILKGMLYSGSVQDRFGRNGPPQKYDIKPTHNLTCFLDFQKGSTTTSDSAKGAYPKLRQVAIAIGAFVGISMTTWFVVFRLKQEREIRKSQKPDKSDKPDKQPHVTERRRPSLPILNKGYQYAYKTFDQECIQGMQYVHFRIGYSVIKFNLILK